MVSNKVALERFKIYITICSSKSKQFIGFRVKRLKMGNCEEANGFFDTMSTDNNGFYSSSIK